MREAPCKDCIERKKLLNKEIYSCHSVCELYKRYDETMKRAREARMLESSSKEIFNEGYRRTTRGKYQNYNRR